jgi:hypothetical protein
MAVHLRKHHQHIAKMHINDTHIPGDMGAEMMMGESIGSLQAERPYFKSAFQGTLPTIKDAVLD